MNLFKKYNKSKAMELTLEHLGVQYKPGKGGWQKVRCPYKEGHAHGDRNPSGSVNLGVGVFTCHACGAAGDWARLLYEIEGITVDKAVVLLGLEDDDEVEYDDPTEGGIFLY